MTPAARYAAAIDVLDDILAGAPAEKCLTNWARTHRFAGSKDRAAIRDHVFDVLRAKRSLAIQGGGKSGRQLVLGLLRRNGIPADTVFGAGGYAPEGLSDAEQAQTSTSARGSLADQWDLPDWLVPLWQDSLKEHAQSAAIAQTQRAPVFVRVNLRRATRAAALDLLADDGIIGRPHETVKTAVEVIENPRRIQTCRAYQTGVVELQDAASQAAMLLLDLAENTRVLDYCAGGGGKALALADMYLADVIAHDIDEQRMVDLPARATRAGVTIATVGTGDLGNLDPLDVVLCDAPCSGSGTWRRTPQAKWQLSQEKLTYYNALQSEVLAKGAKHVRAGGRLVYATCSVLHNENHAIIDQFLNTQSGWEIGAQLCLRPDAKGDGFFLTVLQSPVE